MGYKCSFFIHEACIGILGIQNICHFTSRDIGYCVQIILVNFRGIEYLGKLIIGILIFCQFIRDTCLFTSRDMGYLVTPYTSLIHSIKPFQTEFQSYSPKPPTNNASENVVC